MKLRAEDINLLSWKAWTFLIAIIDFKSSKWQLKRLFATDMSYFLVMHLPAEFDRLSTITLFLKLSGGVVLYRKFLVGLY